MVPDVFRREIHETGHAIPIDGVGADVADRKRLGVSPLRIVEKRNLVERPDLELVRFHSASPLHVRNPLAHHLHRTLVRVVCIDAGARPLVVKVVADVEVLREERDAADLTSVRKRLRAERRCAAVVAVPVREEEIVDGALRNEPLHIPAHPLAAEPVRRRAARDVLEVLLAIPVAAVEKHRRAVGKDEERLLPDARLDKMDVELSRPPAGIHVADIRRGRRSFGERNGRARVPTRRKHRRADSDNEISTASLHCNHSVACSSHGARGTSLFVRSRSSSSHT